MSGIAHPPPFFLHIFLFTTGVDTKYELYRGINVHKSIKSRPLNFLCRCGGQELLSRSFISFRRHASCLLLRRLWQYQLRSFQGRDTKFIYLWLKMKSLSFANWCYGEVSRSGEKFDFQSQFFTSKIIRIFLIFFLLENTKLGTHFLLVTFFDNINF